MNRLMLLFAATASLGFSLAITQAEESESKLKPVCPVSAKAISKDNAVAYKGAEVFFCCENCPKAFKANTAKFAAKANLQLVVTEQAEQVKCPISGQDLSEDQSTKVAGLKVSFCCEKCLAKTNKAEGDEQIKLVFSDEAFKKGFKVKKAE